MGISLVSVSEQIDTSTSHGNMFFQITGSFAEFERKRINERTSEGKKQKLEKGLFTAGKVPYGYNLEESKYISVVPEEAANIEQIFKLRVARKSYRKIAVEVFGDERKFATVRYILSNPAYIGKLRQEGGKIVTVPRIVSTQLFNKVNKKK